MPMRKPDGRRKVRKTDDRPEKAKANGCPGGHETTVRERHETAVREKA